MNLSPFQDIQYDDTEALDDFKCSLQINHDKIAQIMFKGGLAYKTFPLIDSGEHQKDWQQNLQQELGSIFKLLNLTGLPDLASADLNREDDFSDFMDGLIQVEITVNKTLGIT
jgi:hypothetical protein